MTTYFRHDTDSSAIWFQPCDIVSVTVDGQQVKCEISPGLTELLVTLYAGPDPLEYYATLQGYMTASQDPGPISWVEAWATHPGAVLYIQQEVFIRVFDDAVRQAEEIITATGGIIINITPTYLETIPLSDRQVQDMIASLATALRDLYMGYPVKELIEHPRDLLARVITHFAERGELDDDMRLQWEVD